MSPAHSTSVVMKEKEATAAGTELAQIETFRTAEILEFQDDAGTKRGIKPRHAQMIAIGGSIGTGLFVGAGQALARGGPAFLLTGYCLIAMLVYGVVTAVIEVGTYLPVKGCSMSYFANRFISPSVGFALGWLYFYSFGILVAYEITAAGIVISYWPNSVSIAVWITIMIIVIIALNLSPVAVYAETEFWFAGIKVIMIVGLLILSVVLILGGGPTHNRLGFTYWNDPGATKEYLTDGAGGRFTAFLYTWVFAGFSFYFGPELIIFTAGEMKSPRSNLPIAAKQFFWRLVFFYVFGVIAIGAICNSTDPRLTDSSGTAKASPWVIAIEEAGIATLPSIINAGILISAWSAGNAFLYMSSRSLYSLALSGNAPKVFLKCNRSGVPYAAVAASSCFAALAYLNVSSSAGVVFNWFISLTNTAGFTSWIICCVVFIRFRKALDFRGQTSLYRSRIQPYAAWICLGFFVFLLFANGFTVFFPGKFTASGFLTNYIGIPFFLLLWIGHKLVAGRKDPWYYDVADIDLVTGLAAVEADAATWKAIKDEKLAKNGPPNPVYKVLSRLCGD